MKKKTFWGYDPKLTDDYISSLESQVDILTSKLTAMSMDLNSANDELSYLREKSKSPKELSDTNETLEKKIQEVTKENNGLIEKYAQLRDEKNKKIAILMEENEKLVMKIKKLEEQVSKKSDEEKSRTDFVRNDFILAASRERAFDEMERIRKAAREDMINNVDEYVAALEESNNQLKAIVSELRAEYNAVSDDLAKSVNKVFEALWVMDAYNERVEKDLISTKSISVNLKQRIDEMCDESAAGTGKMPKIRPEIFRGSAISDKRRDELMSKFNPDYRAESEELSSAKEETAEIQEAKNDKTDIGLDDELIVPKKPETLKINTKIKPIDVFGLK
ncbi:MAG: hypothetical protein PHY15_07115 [Eubacteriales bacterium]|nr:hypothetical protein [Eubacteriales bacterium]MDD4476059.1 hypothetical protein [Eubacteriales bacterium]